MAFLLNKTAVSALRLHSQKSGGALAQSARAFHVEPGAREKALLAADPSLRRFKPYNQSLKRLKKIGDVLTIIVVAGCCYEIYVKATMREEARKHSD